MLNKKLLMTGFEPGPSDVGSNHSDNCATTIALVANYYLEHELSDTSSLQGKLVEVTAQIKE